VLYSKNGARPSDLPHADTSGEGLDSLTWTDLANNAEGRAACGWVEAPEPPAYDPEVALLTWTNGAWAIEPRSAEEIAADLDQLRRRRLADLAAIRWDRMQVMTFGGQRMPADDTTIGRCTAAEAYARNKGMDFEEPRNWKVADGVFTTLTTTAIIAYGMAIGDHMQGCYDHELALTKQLLAAGDKAALMAVDLDAGWPE
jgi:hypothetical protein